MYDALSFMHFGSRPFRIQTALIKSKKNIIPKECRVTKSIPERPQSYTYYLKCTNFCSFSGFFSFFWPPEIVLGIACYEKYSTRRWEYMSAKTLEVDQRLLYVQSVMFVIVTKVESYQKSKSSVMSARIPVELRGLHSQPLLGAESGRAGKRRSCSSGIDG